MGRRVYEEETGDFVWKYIFGDQPSEQGRIRTDLKVGGYGFRYLEPEWYEGKWCQGSEDPCGDILCIHRSEIPKLEKWIKGAGNYQKADAEGIKELNSFLDSQSKVFQDEFKSARKWKCLEDFEYYGAGHGGMSFDTFKIWCKGFNKVIKEDAPFYLMVRAFVEFMKDKKYKNREIFKFGGEF